MDPTLANQQYLSELVYNTLMNGGQLPTSDEVLNDFTSSLLPNYLYMAQPQAFLYDKSAGFVNNLLPKVGLGNYRMPTVGGDRGILSQGKNFLMNQLNSNTTSNIPSPNIPTGIETILSNSPGGFSPSKLETQKNKERVINQNLVSSRNNQFERNKERFADRYNPKVGFTKGR